MNEADNYGRDNARGNYYPPTPHVTSGNPAYAGDAPVQRLRPHVSDREVHQVAAVLLDFRNSPMGELEMARLIIERLDDTRFGPR